MGLFKDFATSGYGDFTVGALQGLSEAGQRDAAKNERFAADALNKENESMKVTELAYKNKQQINKIQINSQRLIHRCKVQPSHHIHHLDQQP